MKLFLAAAVLAGCGDDPVSTTFAVHDTVVWSAGRSTDVLELRVDGEVLPSDTWLMIDETYPSYANAKAQFVPRTIEVTTAAGTQTKIIAADICEDGGVTGCPQRSGCGHILSLEAVSYELRSFDGEPSFVGAFKGRCEWADASAIGWID